MKIVCKPIMQFISEFFFIIANWLEAMLVGQHWPDLLIRKHMLNTPESHPRA